MSYESTKYYFANPKIHLFPRSLKYLLKEEKKTENGTEKTEKKCELNEILTTYKDDNAYCFAGKYFKEIEKRVYLDLNTYNSTNNEYTVIKKFCVGFLAKQGDTYKFTDKQAVFCSIELKCEVSDSNITAYLKYDDIDNSSNPQTPISLNLNNIENRIKELSLIIKYSADAILPVKSDLKIYAKHANSNDWKETYIFKLYRNTENSLDGFKQSSGQDTDFFVLPRVNPSENQKKCIKQLQIINNQVFARNASLTNFEFVEESGEIEKTIPDPSDNTKTKIIYIDESMKKNACNSLEAFQYDIETNTGCKSGNKIGVLSTNYSYNFSNYGHNKGFIDYLKEEYSLDAETLKGRIYDRNFLFGNYKDGDPDNKIEGIVNLYKKVVVNFISNTLVEANRYVNFPNRWLSCPKFNPNYHRGNFTTQNATKYLYSSVSANQMPGTIYTNLTSMAGYNGTINHLPAGTTVKFVIGKDKYAYKTNESHYYEINEIKFPGQNGFNSVPQRLWIQLSDEEKRTCDDSQFDENYSDYGLYSNNGVPYFISGNYDSEQKFGGKHAYKDFEEMTVSNNNWYSYEPRPSMFDSVGIGLDCSGFIINCICDCNNFGAFNISVTDRKNGMNVTDIKNAICRAIKNNQNQNSNYDYLGFFQKSDVIMSEIPTASGAVARHIVLCNNGEVHSTFNNTVVTQEVLNTGDVQVIHNYGATRDGEKNYIKTNGTYNYDGCYMKTLQGPYNHTGISLLDVTQKIKKEITLGRIYLWKKEN